ncbi:hypothetical protein B9Z19DRAFT_1071001 [Tuber borchii]|uniref:Uncharacterized protein n=1 Tax=Tuber borchii TaxID=42251 RepID=A0A2T7A8P8_TUBBO|nr:hypothetical protein B9Z19DRAFT_1071001 [Tuber borchii]
MAINQRSWGGPDGQYTPPNRTPLFTTTTVTYYTSVEIPKTLTTLTPPLPITTTTDTATTTFFQTSTIPSIITITSTVFRPFPAPTNSGTTPTSTGASSSSFRNNKTHWNDWSPGHRAGFVIGLLLGVMAAALVLFCMAKRYRRGKRDPESGGGLWGRKVGSDDDSDAEGTAAAAASGGINRFAAGILGGGNKKYREGKGLKRDGIGRAHKKIDIHQISDPVFMHSTRGGIGDIAGTDQRPPAGAALPPQRSGEGSNWPLPMAQNEASGAASSSASGQRRVYSRREQGSSESPSVRAVSYTPLPAEEMTEDEGEEVSRGIAKGGRKLQRRMRR